MDEKRLQKNTVEHELRQAARRIKEEAADIGVDVPPSAKMVLSASHEDFLVAQHRGPASAVVIAEKINGMERELDELATAKLGAAILRREPVQVGDPEGNNSQNPSDATV